MQCLIKAGNDIDGVPEEFFAQAMRVAAPWNTNSLGDILNICPYHGTEFAFKLFCGRSIGHQPYFSRYI